MTVLYIAVVPGLFLSLGVCRQPALGTGPPAPAAPMPPAPMPPAPIPPPWPGVPAVALVPPIPALPPRHHPRHDFPRCLPAVLPAVLPTVLRTVPGRAALPSGGASASGGGDVERRRQRVRGVEGRSGFHRAARHVRQDHHREGWRA